MGRHLEFVFCVLSLISSGLLSRADISESICSNYATSDNICVCYKTDTDRLLVNCTGRVGPLRREDILCCTPHENSTAFNEVYTNPSQVGGIDPDDVEVLYTVNSDLREFDFRILSNFTSLHTLNISRSGIVNVTWENCSLPALKYLDFSHNNMTVLNKDFFKCNRSLSFLGLAGTPWDCELLSWFIDWVRKPDTRSLEIPGKNDIICHYYSITTPRTAKMWGVIDSCPKNCSCDLVRFDMMLVDCSGRGYYDFPETIPYNTRVMHMENNNIHSFQRLLNITTYQNLTMLYLDNNAMDSLKELEGIQRYLRLMTLHLAGNRITHLSIYIMEQLEADNIKLGGNPWNCDCKQGTSLLNYLTDLNHRKIQDIDNITCAATDPKHANKVVHRLTATDLCYSESQKIHPLDIVNSILGLLILIVLVKLVYDWWQYKHKGQLPTGPTYIAQLWKQRGARLNRVKLDCTKSLINQKEPSSPTV